MDACVHGHEGEGNKMPAPKDTENPGGHSQAVSSPEEVSKELPMSCPGRPVRRKISFYIVRLFQVSQPRSKHIVQIHIFKCICIYLSLSLFLPIPILQVDIYIYLNIHLFTKHIHLQCTCTHNTSLNATRGVYIYI